MSLEITGTVAQVLPEQTGNGRNGVWVKQPFVIQIEGTQYPRQICFEAWSDKADVVKNLRPGEQVKVSFDPESREFNGKWYTNLKAWRIERMSAGNQAAGAPDPSYSHMPPPPADEPPMPTGADDLPF